MLTRVVVDLFPVSISFRDAYGGINSCLGFTSVGYFGMTFFCRNLHRCCVWLTQIWSATHTHTHSFLLEDKNKINIEIVLNMFPEEFTLISHKIRPSLSGKRKHWPYLLISNASILIAQSCQVVHFSLHLEYSTRIV